jgi:2,3-bisphosphoglycerate-independent phosphoglycerate mutase
VVKAVETTDACLGRVIDAVQRAGGVAVVIADHGNAETLLQPDGVSPHTAHTTNPVPIIVTAPGQVADGELSDIAPTLLQLAGIDPPGPMTGKNLVQIP